MEKIQDTIATAILNEGEAINSTKKLTLTKPNSKSNSRGTGARTSRGMATIVNSNKNGKRITFAKKLLEKLGISETVDVSITRNGIVIGSKIPENAETFTLRTSGSKGVIYSYSLAEEISAVFELDFSERVSMTFTEVEFINDGDYFYAEIKIK